MIKQPDKFHENDSDHSILLREGDVILTYWQRTNSKAKGYDVMRLRKYKDHTFEFTDKTTGEKKSNFSPAHETTPPNSAWGTEGWSFNGTKEGEDRAILRFEAEVAKNPFSSIMGEATGKPRGRARNEFELDLTPFAGRDFLFSELVDIIGINPPEAIIRNRLKAEVDSGKVQIVGTVPGGRGKPKNIYRLS